MRTKRVRALDVAPERSRQDSPVAGLQTAIVAALAGGDQNHEGLPPSKRFRFASLSNAHDFRGQQSRCRPPAQSSERNLSALRRGGPGVRLWQVVRIDQVRFSAHPRLSPGSRYHLRCERDFNRVEQYRPSLPRDDRRPARRDPGERSAALGRMPHQPHLSLRGKPLFDFRLQAAGRARNATVSAMPNELSSSRSSITVPLCRTTTQSARNTCHG